MFVLILALMFVQASASAIGWRAVADGLTSVVPRGVDLLADAALEGWPF